MTETTRQALFTQDKRLREAANRIETYANGYAAPDSNILIAESELIAHIAVFRVAEVPPCSDKLCLNHDCTKHSMGGGYTGPEVVGE